MNKAPRPNTAFARQLREALEARITHSVSGGPSSACLDEETLAAWADDELDAATRATVENHAADCARCQSLLAAMVRTSQPAADAKTLWWRAPAMKWFVPLTATAAVLLIWAALPNRQVARSGVPVAAVTGTPSAPAPDSSIQMREPIVPRVEQRASGAMIGSAERRENGSTKTARAVPPRLDDAKAAPSPEAAAAPPSLSPTVSSPPAAEPLASPAPSPSAAAAAPPEGAGNARAPARSQAQAADSFARAARQDSVVKEIATADATTRWRIAPGGAVQRSTDGGSTWQVQQTGAGVTLAAGAAPSRLVCWLVGPSGTVLLQTDGATWRRIAFPERVDLVAIRARDASQATVTTVDGRTFETTDSGVSWTRSPAP